MFNALFGRLINIWYTFKIFKSCIRDGQAVLRSAVLDFSS